MNTAFVTGVTGQDGYYMSKFLLDKGYTVYGFVRRSSHPIPIDSRIKILYGDITDIISIINAINSIKSPAEQLLKSPAEQLLKSPAEHCLEIYNFAAQSYVKESFNSPDYTTETNAKGVLYLLEAVRITKIKCKVFQASTSEMFGKVKEIQNEDTPFYPRSPYGIAKLFAYWTVINYRESYGLFACNAICMNHESPKRSPHFVTRKISLGVAAIANGSAVSFSLGNLNARRDWGHSSDYTEAIYRIMHHSVPDDFVISSGVSHTVREFVEEAFRVIDIEITWVGTGLSEIGVDQYGNTRVTIDPENFRPAEVDFLQGDSSKAKRILGWTPTKTFKDIVREMVESDLRLYLNK